MKSKMVLSISGILFIMLPVLSFSQSSVSYGYDANGNRISTVIVLKKTAEKESTDTTLYASEYVYEMKKKAETSEGLTHYNVKAFPNPTRGQVHLTTNLKGKVRYTLYDMNGKKQLEGAMVKQTDIDLSKAKAGMYFLNLHARKEDIKKTIKILKK